MSNVKILSSNPHRRLQHGYYVLQVLNSLATAYYFNYLFFYMAVHFGFGNRDNFLVSALYGITYMIASWYAGRFAQRHGYFGTLRVGFGGMCLFMTVGALAPRVLGYSHVTMILEWVILACWVPNMCLTWPTLQALLNLRAPGEGSRTAGLYNMGWSGAAAVSYFTSGILLDTFGGEILFWVPAGLHVIQLLLLPRLRKLDAATPLPDGPLEPKLQDAPTLNPRPIAKARTFVYLARIANPFAYVAIYGVFPVIPKLAEHFGLTPTLAGLICSVWLWTRLCGFLWFWLWPGWHYQFRWLFLAFVMLIASYVGILLCTHIWMLIVAQMIFGLSASLIYYSSLFYSMDMGESKGSRSGFHEAAIGLGVFIGPMAGVLALMWFPQVAHAGMWGITTLLVLGLGLFLFVRGRGLK